MSIETIIIAVIAMGGTLGGGWFAFKQGYANTLNKRENDLWGRVVSRQTIQDVTKEVMARWHGREDD